MLALTPTSAAAEESLAMTFAYGEASTPSAC